MNKYFKYSFKIMNLCVSLVRYVTGGLRCPSIDAIKFSQRVRLRCRASSTALSKPRAGSTKIRFRHAGGKSHSLSSRAIHASYSRPASRNHRSISAWRRYRLPKEFKTGVTSMIRCLMPSEKNPRSSFSEYSSLQALEMTMSTSINFRRAFSKCGIRDKAPSVRLSGCKTPSKSKNKIIVLGLKTIQKGNTVAG